MLLGLAETHHRLDAGAVVPGAVEQHRLAIRRQVRDIALEIPLAGFALARLGQGDDAGLAWRHVLGDALDRAILSGGVAAFKDDDGLAALVDGPVLGLDQQDLETLQFGVIF